MFLLAHFIGSEFGKLDESEVPEKVFGEVVAEGVRRVIYRDFLIIEGNCYDLLCAGVVLSSREVIGGVGDKKCDLSSRF